MSKRLFTRTLPVLATFALFTACADPNTCDPTNDEMFTSIACSVGGGYQKRTNNLNAEKTTLTHHEKYTEQQVDDTADETQKDEKKTAALKQNLAQYQAKKAALEKQLKEAKANNDTAKIQLLESELDKLNAKNSKMSAL